MPFADELIGRSVARRLADVVAAVLERPAVHLTAATAQLDDLTLRARADLLRDALLLDVGGTYPTLADVVRQASADPRFTGWLIWPVTSAIATRAADDGTIDAFDDAMRSLAELTSRLTSEFAIRTMLRIDAARAVDTMSGWTGSADEHVRRLASEGSRPFLPWAVRVPALLDQPDTTRRILDVLYRDPSDYVRRSVANHLNDLSRIAPRLTLQIASSWLHESDENTMAVIRHGLRTLVKKGDSEALALLGFSGDSLRVETPILSSFVVRPGDALIFEAVVHNDGVDEARVAVDYKIHYQKANGLTVPKTFKLTVATIAPGEALQVRKSHSFRELSTRRHYPGEHAVSVSANGVLSEAAAFDVVDLASSPARHTIDGAVETPGVTILPTDCRRATE
ncbi:DNA alkylation repair protein [Curtobacterium sp. USHLN213]|uniref:DNA alkylation repair protein n=1 Tax=Curtobacterium sp. USHLN213 TaxID=3081255 RepID=UPI00301A8BD1